MSLLDEYSPYKDPGFDEWKKRLDHLSDSGVQVRPAEPTAEDGRRMRWVQAACESLFIHDVGYNVSRIEKQTVLIAEVSGDPVGFCIALAGRAEDAPVFVQLVAVVPEARRRGAGVALLHAVASAEPQRDIVMATLDSNTAARALNEHFAASIGATIRRVPIRSFRRSEMGFAEGEKHRPWIITRSARAVAHD